MVDGKGRYDLTANGEGVQPGDWWYGRCDLKTDRKGIAAEFWTPGEDATCEEEQNDRNGSAIWRRRDARVMYLESTVRCCLFRQGRGFLGF